MRYTTEMVSSRVEGRIAERSTLNMPGGSSEVAAAGFDLKGRHAIASCGPGLHDGVKALGSKGRHSRLHVRHLLEGWI
jgi:hypothetical protein